MNQAGSDVPVTDQPGNGDEAVVLQQVSRSIQNGDGDDRIRIIDQVDLRVDRGQLVHIIGPSGSGKSSLIRLINRLDEPSEGRIMVLGQALGAWPVRQLRRRVAMMFQEPSLLNRCVRENLLLPWQLNGTLPDDIDDRIERAMKLADADIDLLERESDELSVGQKQRITLARALVGEPDILLLDEPTASLDPRTAEDLLDRLVALQQEHELTILAVSHRLEEVRHAGGEMTVLIKGHIAAQGPVDKLFADPPTDEVGRFLTGAKHDAGSA